MTWKPFDSLELANAKSFVNDTMFSMFQGLDLTSELQVGECNALSQRGEWVTQRIGPLNTKGGASWIQLGWGDAAGLRQKGYVGISAHVVGPTDFTGSHFIGHPPLHFHHFHLLPGVLETNNARLFCRLKPEWCKRAAPRFLEHHADWQFEIPYEADGFGCDHYPHLKYPSISFMETPLMASTDLVDTRPALSPSLTWYLQLSLRISEPQPASLALSVHKTHAPIYQCPDQFCDFGTMLLPAEELFFYYNGVMPHSGFLLDVVYHAHGQYIESMLFASSAAQLRINMYPPGIIIRVRDSPFHNLVDFRKFLTLNGTQPVCSALPRTEIVHRRAYQRVPLIVCDDWEFVRGANYLVVSLQSPNHPMRQHDIWFLTYSAVDGASHYTYVVPSLEDMAESKARIHRLDALFPSHLVLLAVISAGLSLATFTTFHSTYANAYALW
eukprot:CAMPEP_0115863052 /NCGR_PEP_ID=MMETSP0287-20121206/18496_1 /TAXON_ID=412157 /ORGANISM="Chrysochromulina rotalis, Strain UIO044" /LENGTH=440 /DNA_ID=CAMNT_0003317499 /DNA_START=87 /DNA_END=1409 /DNA_ORIENTATION=-